MVQGRHPRGEKGEIEIQTHDQLAPADQLNKLQSAYVTLSLSGNINLNEMIGPVATVDADTALRIFEAFGPPS